MTVAHFDLVQDRATKDLGLEIAARIGSIFLHVVNPDTKCGSAIVFAHDELLRNVVQTTGQVTRVGSTKCSVYKALTSAWRRDEVLECFETFTEVVLDRARNHVTARVGHETTHTGDLTHLGHVSTST